MMTGLLRERHTVLEASSRLEDLEQVTDELERVRPDRVVLAAGITGRPNVDWCESHRQETFRVNVTGTIHVAKECARLGIHVTNFGTGCIFEYDDAHAIGGPGFTETDSPNFTKSYYSHTKALAEGEIARLPGHLLLRVRMPITADGAARCFLTKIANYPKIVDVPNSVTVLPTLLPLAVEMMESGDAGIYNFVNPGPVSHAELLLAYRHMVDPLFQFHTMGMEEHDATAVIAKRSNNALSAEKLCGRFPGRVPHAAAAIQGLFGPNQPLLRKQFIPKGVLVTGGAGFIGSNFVRHLSRCGVPCVVFDLLTPSASEKHIEGLAHVKLVKGDILDEAMFGGVLDAHPHVDTVVHFAAETHVDSSYTMSTRFTAVNVLGTHVVLEAVRSRMSQIKRFVHISTDEVYGETKAGETEGMAEDRVLLPTNPYAASKVGAEALVHAYCVSFSLPAVVVRANNIFGPRQFPEKVIPRFILRSLCDLPLQVQGTGQQTRHFVYVDDACTGVSSVLSCGVAGEVYNIASTDELSVMEVARAVQDALGTARALEHVEDRAFNDRRYWVSDAKLRGLFWQPKVAFAEGLRRTIAYYRNNQAVLDMIWPAWEQGLCALDAAVPGAVA